MHPSFEGGLNIAVKIPKSKYEETLRFYRDTLRLPLEERPISNPTVSRTCRVQFGSNTLWLDCVDNYTHSEVWLELKTPDVAQAVQHLAAQGTVPCDELEALPEGMHWIMDPAGTVFVLGNDA